MYEIFPEFQVIPWLGHAISMRVGGVSEGNYSSLNMGFHVGDNPDCVKHNRQLLAQSAGYHAEWLVTGQQVHGVQIALVTAEDRGRGAFSWEDALPATDGLMTATAGIPLAILVADCAPVLLVDPTRRVLAVVHAGWRGALGRIASHAVNLMGMHCESIPGDLIVGIGPTLCMACCEVGKEVASEVHDAFGLGVHEDIDGKPHLSIAGMITHDLVGAGVQQIHRYPLCPRCRNDRFFSHRGQRGQAGRQALVAWIKE